MANAGLGSKDPLWIGLMDPNTFSSGPSHISPGHPFFHALEGNHVLLGLKGHLLNKSMVLSINTVVHLEAVRMMT